MRRILLALAATAAMTSFAHAQATTTPAPGNPTAPAAPAPMAPAPDPVAPAPAAPADLFVTAKPTDVLSYNLVGLNITDRNNESIGEIKDLVISDGLLSGYIVSVGGFLGMGERYVIVSPAAVDVAYSDADAKWSARIDTTKEALTNAPEFKYEGRWAK